MIYRVLTEYWSHEGNLHLYLHVITCIVNRIDLSGIYRFYFKNWPATGAFGLALRLPGPPPPRPRPAIQTKKYTIIVIYCISVIDFYTLLISDASIHTSSLASKKCVKDVWDIANIDRSTLSTKSAHSRSPRLFNLIFTCCWSTNTLSNEIIQQLF